MARVELMTLPDEGAAEMVRGALNEVGIEPEFERVFLEHPFRASVVAEPWRVFVPADRLAAAQTAVERLVHDMASEVETQSMAWSFRAAETETSRDDGDAGHPDGHARDASAFIDSTWRPSRSTTAWALALTILIPLLTIGLYHRKSRSTLRPTPGIGAQELRPPSSLFVN
ncbi:MAG TPA: hypothetical protein VGF45_04205 [Polyangia bacterium]